MTTHQHRTGNQHRTGSGLRDGLVAGAVGTTVLTAVTYADMALRGRDASTTPEETVDALAGALGTSIGGTGQQRANRRTALGALSGTVAGLATGAVLGAARRAGLRLPAGVGGVVTGAVAMAATDLPAHALGVTDLRDWTGADWASDALPHLAFGVAAHATLRRLDPPAPRGSTAVVDRPDPAGAGLLARSALLGVAAGGRSSLGLAGPALTASSTAAGLGSLLPVAAELVADKNPATPSRLSPQGLPLRLVSGAGGAAVLARRRHQRVALPAVAGALGALAGSVAGASWRAWATSGPGLTDRQAALAEDAVSVALALLASRR